MRVRLAICGQEFHKDVKDVFVWRGSRRKIPDWISERLDRGDAVIGPTKAITMKDKNGYHTADKGTMILHYGDDQIDVLWGFKRRRTL